MGKGRLLDELLQLQTFGVFSLRAQLCGVYTSYGQYKGENGIMKIIITSTELEFTAEELRASNSLADNIACALRSIFGRISNTPPAEEDET